MKYLRIFEDFQNNDEFKLHNISSVIRQSLNNLKERGFSIKIRGQHSKGPAKKISQTLGIPSRIQVDILKLREGMKPDEWRGKHSDMTKFNYDTIESDIVNLTNSLEGKFNLHEIRLTSGNYTNILHSLKKIEKEPRWQKYSFIYTIKSGILPGFSKKTKIEGDSYIKDAFTDLSDAGMSLNFRKIGDFIKIAYDNLKQDSSATSFGGNVWVPLTDEEKKILVSSIDISINVYDMEFFSVELKYKDLKGTLKDKNCKSYNDFVEFLYSDGHEKVDIVGFTILLKNTKHDN